MPTLGSERYKTFGTDVEKLFNGRFRLMRRFHEWSTEDEYGANIGTELFEDFGALDGTPFGSAPATPLAGSTYANCRLTRQYTTYPPGLGFQILVKEYETLTNTFVAETEERLSVTESGLARRENTLIGRNTATYTGVVGVSNKTVDGVVFTLASFREVESTEALRRIEEVWQEAGVLSRSEDFVGSQNAIIIEAFNQIPSVAGHELANKQESNFEGIKTNRYTFLKPSVLSRTEDLVRSQKAIVIEAFAQVPSTPSGYSLANKQESDYEGIITSRYTFIKNNAVLSRSRDRVGSQLAVVLEVFGDAPIVADANAYGLGTAYVLANEQESDVDGLPTHRLTFLEPGILVKSDSRGPVAGTKTVTIESFHTKEIPSGGVIIEDRESDVEGIPTFRVSSVVGTITGVKSTWSERVDVWTPGVVTLLNEFVDIAAGDGANFSGNVPVLKYTPKRRRSLSATVKLEILDAPPGAFTPAFNLSDLSCSVTATQASARSNGVDTLVKSNITFIGDKVSGQLSAKVQPFPESYISGPTQQQSLVTFTTGWYDNSPGSPTVLSPRPLVSAIQLTLTGEGSTSLAGYTTTGIIQRRARELFSSLDGTQRYWEVITYEV